MTQKPNLVENDLYDGIKNALKGDFNMLKPYPCQAPPVPSDETYILRHAEDQLDTPRLNSDSDSYGTAISQGQEFDYSDSEFDKFSFAEEPINIVWSNDACVEIAEDHMATGDPMTTEAPELKIDPENSLSKSVLLNDFSILNQAEKATATILPEKTTDQFIFRDQYGQLRRFQSSLNWAFSQSDKNINSCLDCAAQISTRDVSFTEHEGTATSMSILDVLASEPASTKIGKLLQLDHLTELQLSERGSKETQKSCCSATAATTERCSTCNCIKVIIVSYCLCYHLIFSVFVTLLVQQYSIV